MPPEIIRSTDSTTSKCQTVDCKNNALFRSARCWSHLEAQERREWINEIEQIIRKKTVIEQACLEHADFSDHDLKGAMFDRCKLSGVRFDYADLSYSVFTQCAMAGCSFAYSNLEQSRIEDCHLPKTRFLSASLCGVSLIRSDLTNASLNKVRWPNGIATSAVFNGAQLHEADLIETDFSNARMARADLTSSRAGGAVFIAANLSKASFIGALIDGANFEYANLRDAALKGAKCDNTDFHHAELTGCYFDSANISNAQFDRGALRQSHLSAADVTGLDLPYLGISNIEVITHGGRSIVNSTPTEIIRNPKAAARLFYLPLLYWTIDHRRRFNEGFLNPTLPSLLLAAIAFLVVHFWSSIWASPAFVVVFMATNVLWRFLKMQHSDAEIAVFKAFENRVLYRLRPNEPQTSRGQDGFPQEQRRHLDCSDYKETPSHIRATKQGGFHTIV